MDQGKNFHFFFPKKDKKLIIIIIRKPERKDIVKDFTFSSDEE